MRDLRPKLLILSFSDIANDARVRKQVLLFTKDYQVTTCGFGEALRADIQHLKLTPERSAWDARIEGMLLRLGAYRAAYWRHPYLRRARTQLRRKSFDVVIANDLESVGFAQRKFGAKQVHVDLHEFFPGLHDQVAAWNHLRRPFIEWQLRTFLPRATSVTTVSDMIAERYHREYGFECSVVRNASPRQDLSPVGAKSPLRIVHSGGAQPNRRIEVMMKGVANSTSGATLDLYLTHEKSHYADELRALALDLGERISIHPPLPQSKLIEVLNRFDVGIHVLPATNTNNELALPNKFFDFIQARLAMIIGPTADMMKLLETHGLGKVTNGFEVGDVTAAVDDLDIAQVNAWKQNANIAAELLNAEREQDGWMLAVSRIAPS